MCRRESFVIMEASAARPDPGGRKPAEITVTGMGRRPAALYGGVTAGVIVGIVVLIGATAFGLARRRSDGRLRRPRGQWPAAGRPETGQEHRLSEADLGRTLGERATLLQFSSSFCAPCRATRQVLADIASVTQGVAHIEIDVADRVDLVRVLDVRRTPTMFLLDADGRIASRASGAPRQEDVLAALGVVA
jgi:thiol-disulfide isomerase/thioredoxin